MLQYMLDYIISILILFEKQQKQQNLCKNEFSGLPKSLHLINTIFL